MEGVQAFELRDLAEPPEFEEFAGMSYLEFRDRCRLEQIDLFTGGARRPDRQVPGPKPEEPVPENIITMLLHSHALRVVTI
jgi:hypothetical protein